jgi:RecA-family ATPase
MIIQENPFECTNEHYAEAENRPVTRFKLQTAAEFKKSVKAMWRVKDLLPEKGVAAIYGASGAGKSFLALDLACAIAGRENTWFGYRVFGTTVTYIPLEGVYGFKLRMKVEEKAKRRETPKDLTLISKLIQLDRRGDVDALAITIPKNSVVIVDTLACATAGLDENSGKDMGTVLRNLTSLADAIDGLVIVVAHSGKDKSRGLRGWSGLVAAMDATIYVSGDRSSQEKEWSVDKVKDAEAGKVHFFELEKVSLGQDSDGDEIISCVIQPVKVRRIKQRQKLSPIDRVVFAALKKVVDTKGENSVHLEDWREEYYRSATQDNEAAKRKAFLRCRPRLVSMGLAKVDHDVYQIVEEQTPANKE